MNARLANTCNFCLHEHSSHMPRTALLVGCARKPKAHWAQGVDYLEILRPADPTGTSIHYLLLYLGSLRHSCRFCENPPPHQR